MKQMENTKIIKLIDITPGTSTYEEGVIARQALEPYFMAKQKIAIDLTDCISTSSSFLHGLLGDTFDKWGIDYIRNLLKFKNLTKMQGETLKDYARSYETRPTKEKALV